MGNRTKKLQPGNWHKSMKKQPSWETIRSDKADESMAKLIETNQLSEVIYNINRTPSVMWRNLKR